MAERPYNIRAARILEQQYSDEGLNVHRLFTQPRSDEHRMTNRPYRGQHRAEQTLQSEELNAAWQRSTRVGRHHAEPVEDHHTNRR